MTEIKVPATNEASVESEKSGRAKRTLARVGLAVACALGAPLGIAQTAHADTIQHVEGTGGIGLSVREAPTTASGKLATLPEGSEFNVECWTEGETIDGNKIWEKGTGQGARGFVSDRYMNTGYYPTGEELTARGIPKCEEAPSPPKPMVVGEYRRDQAVTWAREHAQDTPPFPASCTQFISKALWFAGVRESHAWNDGEIHGNTYTTGERLGPPAAWNAESLHNYLVSAHPRSYERELDFNQNSVPDAQPGDVIAYDWDGDGKTDHLSIVVDKALDEYPEVAEWSAAGGTLSSPYSKRGWTWSELRKQWIRDGNDQHNARAHLIHIDTRHEVLPDGSVIG